MMAMKRPGTSSEEGRVKVPRLEDSSMCGVIQNIVLTNFMCHGSFEWSPNTNVNFVTGVNGSGKSSILQGTYCHTILQSNQYNPVSSKFMLHNTSLSFYYFPECQDWYWVSWLTASTPKGTTSCRTLSEEEQTKLKSR